jgi:hypothetical protein
METRRLWMPNGKSAIIVQGDHRGDVMRQMPVRALVVAKLTVVAGVACIAAVASASVVAAQTQSSPVQFSLAVGLTWRDTRFAPPDPNWGGVGQVGLLFPIHAHSAVLFSVTGSGFMNADKTLVAGSATGGASGTVGMFAVATDVQYRWYAGRQQAGPFLEFGGGGIRLVQGSLVQWHGLASAGIGFAQALGTSGHGVFIEARYDHAWTTNQPQWFFPVLVGLNWSVGS